MLGDGCPECWYRISVPEGFAPGTVLSVRIPATPALMKSRWR